VLTDGFRGIVQPICISREPDHFNGGKPFRRIRGEIDDAAVAYRSFTAR